MGDKLENEVIIEERVSVMMWRCINFMAKVPVEIHVNLANVRLIRLCVHYRCPFFFLCEYLIISWCIKHVLCS